MALFNRLFRRPAASSSTPPSPIPAAASPGQIVPAPPRKTLVQLEQEMADQQASQILPTRPLRQTPPTHRRSGIVSKLALMGLLVGIPAAGLWVVNQPYPPIRRPIARTMPLLLLPSYINLDQDFRAAIALTQQSTQLIDAAASFADIEIGAQKVAEAQKRLDALPIDLLNYWDGYGSWQRDWRLSPIAFNTARAEIARLTAKVFQEQNAHTALTTAEQALNTARQQYQTATAPLDTRAAITAWRAALNQFGLVPDQTLAGKTARQKLEANQQEFAETVGLAAENQEVAALIDAAKQSGMQAAMMGQNAPHPAYVWMEVERLWDDGIAQLERIPTTDLAGYSEARKILGGYQSNLAQIRIRRQTEENAVQLFRQAQDEVRALQGSVPQYGAGDRNDVISRLQRIVDQLEQVQPSTTVYPEAQVLLLNAKNKLNQLLPQ